MAIQLEIPAATWALGGLVGSTLVLATAVTMVGPRLVPSNPVLPVAESDQARDPVGLEAPMSFQAVRTASLPVDGSGGLGVSSGADGSAASKGVDAGSPTADVYLAVAEGTEAAAVASSDSDRADLERRLAAMRASIQRRKKKIEDLEARIAKGEKGLEGELQFEESVLEIEYGAVAGLLAQLAGMP